VRNLGTDVTAELVERRALRAMVGILRRVDAPHEECGFCHQEEERAAVVAWLRERAEHERGESVWEQRLDRGDGTLARLFAGLLRRQADAIERGEHVEGRDGV
jgi:hypothetical protein